jgi:hypothetical protein
MIVTGKKVEGHHGKEHDLFNHFLCLG